MKKVFIPFLVAGMLSTTSCTELFEPTVDYGNQTYINDYSTLVSAVNDLTKSIGERFEALNTLLGKNLADIKLSIDANSGAIKVLGENMESNLSAINTTLFNGFTALNTQIDETGKQIVYAMNENGELLRLEIEETGKLISAQIESSTKELKEALVAAINSQTTALEQKFEALNGLIKGGFAEVTAKIGEVGDALELSIDGVNTSLGTLNTTMINGFTVLGTKIDDNGNTIATAINEQGEILEAAIEANGTVISAQIKASSNELKEALVAAINSQTTALEQKFEALNGLIRSGFAGVTAKIGEVGDALELSIDGVNTSLGTLNTTMTSGFTTLSTKIDNNGNTIATAINDQGEILEAAIEANGTVISTNIKDFKDAYGTAEAANLAKMAEMVKAINDLTAANNTNSANLLTKLEQLLSDNGIYYDENNTAQMYMTPENFATIQDAGTNSSIYKLYENQLTTLPVTFTSKQVVNSNGDTHEHAIFTPVTSKDAAPVLVASKAEIVDGVANGKKVVKVVKTAVNRNYTVTISSGCNAPYIFGMRLTDANGKKDTTFTHTTSHDFTLIVYNAATSVIENNINAIVYCTGDSSTTYALVNPK